jgi:hypothetical protein
MARVFSHLSDDINDMEAFWHSSCDVFWNSKSDVCNALV